MAWILTIVLLLLSALMLGWFLFPHPLARWLVRAQRSPGRLRSRCTTVDDHNWHWLETGRGDPLILLHGFGGDADHWARVAPRLRRSFRVLAPDLPGWGESDPPTDPDWSMEAQARRLAVWMDAVGVEQCWLGGNSMGGYVAAAFARLYPERVMGLWLLAPGGVRSASNSPLFEEIQAGRHNPLIVRHRQDFHRLMGFCFSHRPWIPGPLSRYLTNRAAMQLDYSGVAFDGMRHHSPPLEELLDKLPIPTLLVWGEEDQVLNPEGAGILAPLLPEVERQQLPECGHLPMLEMPRKTSQRWIRFVAERSRQAEAGHKPEAARVPERDEKI